MGQTEEIFVTYFTIFLSNLQPKIIKYPKLWSDLVEGSDWGKYSKKMFFYQSGV
jgi:hypothetical protein